MHKIPLLPFSASALLIIALGTHTPLQAAPYCRSGVPSAKQPGCQIATRYFIALGAFHQKSNATRLYRHIRATHHYPVKITFKNGYYHVLLGPVHSPQTVKTLTKQLATEMEQPSRILPPPPQKKTPHRLSRAYTQPNYEEPLPYRPSRSRRTTTESSAFNPLNWPQKIQSFFARPAHQYSSPLPRAPHASRLPDNRIAVKTDYFSQLPHFYTVTGGWGQTSLGKAQNIGIEDLIGDYFSVSQKHGYMGLVGLGYYIEDKPRAWINMAYGLNVYYLSQTTVTGYVTQENLFTNLSYRYKASHVPLYAAAKATYNHNDRYTTTLDLGIGPNFMILNKYQETPLNNESVADNAFSNHTSTTFSATVGVGMKFNHVLGPFPLEVGYRFFYLGEGQLNKQSDQLLGNLKTGTVYTNALVGTITF